MCGRYHLTRDPLDTLLASTDVTEPGERDPFAPRYNIAPSEPPPAPTSKRTTPPRLTRVPIARRRDEESRVEAAVWPLVPSWAKGVVTRYSTANARAESMRESRSYRHAWERGQRCLIPATGFFEWQDTGERTKLPWTIGPLNEPHFLFGGLWERSFTADDAAVLSCTIVTVPANSLMRDIHNAGKNRHRMPLILPPERAASWLNGSLEDADALVAPFPADEMRAHPVSTAVNNPGFDEAKVLEEAGRAGTAPGG